LLLPWLQAAKQAEAQRRAEQRKKQEEERRKQDEEIQRRKAERAKEIEREKERRKQQKLEQKKKDKIHSEFPRVTCPKACVVTQAWCTAFSVFGTGCNMLTIQATMQQRCAQEIQSAGCFQLG
jgi:hypothetical protein